MGILLTLDYRTLPMVFPCHLGREQPSLRAHTATPTKFGWRHSYRYTFPCINVSSGDDVSICRVGYRVKNMSITEGIEGIIVSDAVDFLRWTHTS